MARYIDVEQAIHLIENDALSQIYYSKSDAIDCINATPTADVMEVVRCKDCKHFTKEMIAGDLEFICKSAEGMINPAPDKYCSCGTPKERGGEK